MKNTIATFTLAAILTFGTTFANANGGILIANLTGDAKTDKPCIENEKVDSGILVSDLGGILIANFGGILIANFGGILIANATSEPTVNCGILIAN